MPLQTIRAAEARASFAALLRRVSENRERIVIERRGKPRVAVVPVEDLALAEGGSEHAPGASRADEFLRLTQFAVDHASDAVFWIGTDAGFIYVNGTGSRILGYTADEISKLKIFDIDPEIDEDNWPRAWERIKTKSPYTFEAQHRRKDGSAFPVEVSVYFVRYGGEEIICSFSRDITQRKEAEDALRESEARLRAILDHAPMEIYLKDAEGRYVEINRHYEELWGVRDEEIRGKLPGDVHQEEAFAKASRAHDLAVLKSGEVVEQEDEAHLDDGPHILHRTKFPIRDAAGQIAGLGAIAVDVTDRKRAEEALGQARDDLELRVQERTAELQMANEALREEEAKLREILEKSPIGVAIVTHDAEDACKTGERLFVNSAFVRMFGADSHQEAIEGEISGSWVNLDRLHAAEEIMRNRDELVDFEALRRRGDGTEWWVSMNSRPIRFDDQDCNMVWHFDITERKRAEEQLRQAQKMEAIGQLTGGVAHDFNNLLAVIMGNTQLLQDQLGNDDISLSAILGAATRGADLTQRLLAFSRKQTLLPQAVELNALVGGMINLLGRTLGETIEIKTSSHPELWRAKVDPGQLENALLNLAINARDAMPEGGTLVIEAGNASLDEAYAHNHTDVTPGDYVMLAVSDSGSGMSPEVLEHAFEPFFTTKEVGEGSGLGLAMVYGFAKQTGGHAAIYSEEGHGTTVKLYLPRAGEQATRASEEAATEVPRARGETVLVVEDDADVRQLAVAMLEALGYQVLQAPDGWAALSVLEESAPPDLLLSDVVLPRGLSGPDLAEKVKRELPAIKVLFMSGYTEYAARHNGLAGHGAKLLNKPFRKLELALRVRGVLDR